MGDTVAGNIEKDFCIGNTRVKIATDYCSNKTSDEINCILQRISRGALQSFAANRP